MRWKQQFQIFAVLILGWMGKHQNTAFAQINFVNHPTSTTEISNENQLINRGNNNNIFDKNDKICR